MSISLQGVLVASITPLKKDFSIDYENYQNHLKFLKQNQTHGIVVAGTTGEGPTLKFAEREKLIETTQQIFETVVVGCGSNHTEAALEFLLQAASLKASSGLVVTPYYNRPTQKGLIEHYLYLADRSPIPIILYHVPSRTNVTFELETIQTLWEHPNIIGIKEANASPSFWIPLSILAQKKNKSIWSGDDDTFAFQLSLGAVGIISASANLIPKAFVDLWNLSQKKDWEAVYSLQKKIFPLVKTLFQETNPAPIKYLLSTQKKIENILRLPLVGVTDKTQEFLNHEWKQSN